MNRVMTLASLGILTFCAAVRAQEKSVDVVPVKYDELKQEVLKQRGKVLVVDFWAGT